MRCRIPQIRHLSFYGSGDGRNIEKWQKNKGRSGFGQDPMRSFYFS